MAWSLFKADKSRKKWSIQATLWDGRSVKIPGHRDYAVAQQKMRNLELLNRSQAFGELPSDHLAPRINGLPEKDAAFYVKLGLLSRRFVDKRRPLEDILTPFSEHTKLNCKPNSRTVELKIEYIRRIINGFSGSATYLDLDNDKISFLVNGFVTLRGRRKGQPLSQKSP